MQTHGKLKFIQFKRLKSMVALLFPYTSFVLKKWNNVTHQKSVNVIIRGVGMLLSPRALKSLNSFVRTKPKIMCNIMHNDRLLLQSHQCQG